MLTRVLLAVVVVLTLACAGIALHYNHVFTRLEVALAETKAQLAATQMRLQEQQRDLRAEPSKAPAPSPKNRR
ncbi:MAG TPA: hypothetical protein VML56_12020 [Burkholderiales bacterium]|nr:hypothetical protein [Burkholderiales bacterium]